ncbi:MULTISPECIES: S53 family peptidase [unclassified Burkholderia]|uniref:S53 family peptidase n=1 Tax=unclassified Burkholderia TaxID=2613784 RepID=UPI000572A3B1|nr:MULTISPECIES: S53 family peptidase [unclassified Burkholderia]AOK46748.1 peptidase S53 [Burkholderia sp. MSMB617WGS]KVK89097.1 peptidase S53 [Burkholderia sp. MSMB1498]
MRNDEMTSRKWANPRASQAKRAICAATFCAATTLTAHAAAPAWVDTQTRAYPAFPQQASAATFAAGKAIDAAPGEPVRVVVSLNLNDEARLDRFLRDLHTPGNAAYGRHLTPAEFAAQYAPTQQQVALVEAHLRRSGFRDIQVSPNRLLISATGTAAAVKTAFNTRLKSFTLEGRRVHANQDTAQVPAALGSIVGAVLGLDSATLAHTYNRRAAVTGAVGGAKASLAARASDATANAAASGTPVLTGHDPLEFSQIYRAGSTPTASQTTVGVIMAGDAAPVLRDLGTFAAKAGLARVAASVTRTGPPGSDYSDNSGLSEWDMDSQAIVGAAGGQVKGIVFYAAPSMLLTDITEAYNRAVIDNVAKVINVSLGVCEADARAAGTQAADDRIFKSAVAQGQTFAVAAGDAGAYECSVSRVSGGQGVPARSNYSVSEPATSPYVVAVGGTTLSTDKSTGAYAGEAAWNEGLQPIGVYDPYGSYDSTQRLWATGGGYSKNEAVPAWQRSVLGTSARTRAVPDVAFEADGRSGAHVYVNGQIEQWGGTSLAAPIFTGIWARLQSDNGNRLGFPLASLYRYVPSNGTLVHDVTSGNNGSGGYGYKAGTGWDPVTGFGSFDIGNLAAFVKKTADFAR